VKGDVGRRLDRIEKALTTRAARKQGPSAQWLTDARKAVEAVERSIGPMQFQVHAANTWVQLQPGGRFFLRGPSLAWPVQPGRDDISAFWQALATIVREVEEGAGHAH
jgi:hypothetical protein